jgi:dihydropteroate synthase
MATTPRLVTVRDEAEARAELLRLGADPEGARRMAGRMVGRLVKLSAVPCKAANILKQEMLALGGDAAVARGTVACQLPATDVLLIGTDKSLRILARRLASQPFGLREVGEEITQLLERLGHPPRHLVGAGVTLTLDRPRIMGVLNLTPDSFSDGGAFASPDEALRHALQLVADGADILDIGGESTRPGAAEVPTQQELDRVLPVIERLRQEVDIPLSIDTTKAEVARAAMAVGVNFINDISGLTFDSAMVGVAAATGAGLFLMHTRGAPRTMQQDTAYADLLGEILASLQHSLAVATAAGIATERLAVDPGIGFGKSVAGNLEILRRLGAFHSLGYPVLLGTSRKSFIGKTLQQESPADRLYGTLATLALGVASGVQLYRVHDVRAARDVVLMAHAVVGN